MLLSAFLIACSRGDDFDEYFARMGGGVLVFVKFDLKIERRCWWGREGSVWNARLW